jgi:alkaline phosphatase
VHAKGKKVRFWATPDFPEAWEVLLSLKVDVINSDDVAALASFIKQQ